jgi:rhodanese-related sulfurtransferase
MMHTNSPSLALVLSGLLVAGPTCDATDDGPTDAAGETPMDVSGETPPDVGLDTPADGPADTLGDVGSTEATDGPADLPPGDTADDAVDLAWPAGHYITIAEVHARLEARDAEMLLLNVSDEEFYALGHIPGSLAIPWDILPGRIGDVDPTRHVVIYCRRGVRSEAAYGTLSGAGYTMLWIMEGGIEAWTAAGYATVPCEDPSVTCP